MTHRIIPSDYQERVDFMDELGLPAGITDEQFRALELMELYNGKLPALAVIVSDDYSLLFEDLIGHQRIYVDGRTSYVDEAAARQLIAENE